MKLLEKILVGLIIIALLMKFTLITGGSLLLVVTLSSLSCIYFLFGFLFFNGIRFRNISKSESYSGLVGLRVAGAIFTGFALSAVCVGIMFKMMYWPGAQAMLVSGIFPLAIILIVVIIKFLLTKDLYYKRILIRLAIIGVFGFLLLLIPTLTLMKIQYCDHPEYIAAYEAQMKDTTNEELNKKLDLEYKRATMRAEKFKVYEEYLNNDNEKEDTISVQEQEAKMLFTGKKFPKQLGRVNDFEKLFTKKENKQLDSVLSKLTNQTPSGIEMIIVTMDSVERYDTTDYTCTNLLSEWVTDSVERERYVVIIVSKNQRNIAMYSGGALDVELSDSMRTHILNEEITPYFKKDNYYAGIINAIEKIRIRSNLYFCIENPELCPGRSNKRKIRRR